MRKTRTNKYINYASYCLLCASIIASVSVSAAEKSQSLPVKNTVEIKFLVDDDKNSVVRATALKFKELISKQVSANHMKVVVESLGDRDLFEEMRVGNAQMIAPKLSRLKRYSKRLQVFELPFIFYSGKAARNFLDGEWGDRLLHSLKQQNVDAHGYIHQGMKHLTSDTPISLPEDASDKAMGIFYSNTSKQYFEDIGSEIVALNDIEENSALSNGRVNITENNWSRIYNQNIFNEHKYVLESNHTYTGNVLISSPGLLDQMPAKLLPIIEKAIKDSIEYGNEYASKKINSYRNIVLNSGSNIVQELAARDRYLWIEEANKIWSQYEDDIGLQLINAAASHR